MLKTTAYELRSNTGLRVAAVLPDPIQLGQLTRLTSDLRWHRLRLAVLEQGGNIRLARLRPPTPRATIRFTSKANPHVVYLDARTADDGWTLESPAGGEERFDLVGVRPRSSDGPVLITRYGLSPVMRDRAMERGCLATIDLAEHTDDEAAAKAMATILAALARGADLGSAVEAVTGQEHLSGDAGRRLVEEGTSGRPEIIDRSPPGAPEELPEDLWATDALVEIAEPLTGNSYAGVQIVGGKRSGKTEHALTVGRRSSHLFPDGILGMAPGRRISSVADLLEQVALLLSVEPQAETVAHEIPRRQLLIFIDDCHRLESDAVKELAEILGPIPPWCRTKLLLAGQSVPRKLQRKELKTVELGAGLDQESAGQLGEVLVQEQPELDAEWVQKAIERYRGNPSLLKLLLNRAGAFQEEKRDPSLFFKALDGATDLVEGVLPDSWGQYLIGSVTNRYSDRIAQAFEQLDEDETRLFKLLTVFEAPPTYWLIQSFLAKLGERRKGIFDDDFDLDETLDDLIDKSFLRTKDRRLRPNALFVRTADQLWKRGDTKRTEAVDALVASCFEFRTVWGSDVETVKQQLPNLMFALEEADQRSLVARNELAEFALYLYRYQKERGSLKDSRMALQVAEKHAPATKQPEFRMASGDLYRRSGDEEKAAAEFKQAADMTDNDTLRFEALYAAGNSSLRAKKSDDARGYLEQALAAAPEPTDGRLATIRLLLGALHFENDDLAASRDHLEASLDLYGEADDASGQAFSRQWLGRVALKEGEPEAGVDLARQASQQLREMGNDKAASKALREFGRLLKEEHPELADALFAEARGRTEKAGMEAEA